MKLKANGQDVIVTAALVNGNYEPYTLRIFRQMIAEALAKNGDRPCVFVDVGANIGLFTVTAALLDSRIRVFAFEPNSTSYRLLDENVQLNGADECDGRAGGGGGGKRPRFPRYFIAQAGNHSIYSSGTQRVEVPVVCLDDYFSEKKILPSLIKVDVEGYEPRVLQGMKSIPAGHEFQMILEFNPEHLKRGWARPGSLPRGTGFPIRFDLLHG